MDQIPAPALVLTEETPGMFTRHISVLFVRRADGDWDYELAYAPYVDPVWVASQIRQIADDIDGERVRNSIADDIGSDGVVSAAETGRNCEQGEDNAKD